jgi:hypothetical protein
MTKIEKIWSELENDKSLSHGLLIRRYSGDIIPDIFVGIKLPEGYRCIAASLSNAKNLNLSLFTNLRDISVEIIPDDQMLGKNYLIYKLLSAEYRDIFSVLCEDLILSVAPLQSEEKILKELINRFEKWKSLFEKVTLHGLTPEEQKGLFGELYFMRKFLKHKSEFSEIIRSWMGPEKALQDFQSGNWAVEVKTTQGNNHQKVHINSERQLDTSNLDNLILYHLSLDIMRNSGETLNQIVESIRLTISFNAVASTLFNSKLFEAGYFDKHSSYYQSKGYFIRQEIFYKVEKDFPRIEEKDICYGVGDVKYSIIVSNCQSYMMSEKDVFNNIKEL